MERSGEHRSFYRLTLVGEKRTLSRNKPLKASFSPFKVLWSSLFDAWVKAVVFVQTGRDETTSLSGRLSGLNRASVFFECVEEGYCSSEKAVRWTLARAFFGQRNGRQERIETER